MTKIINNSMATSFQFNKHLEISIGGLGLVISHSIGPRAPIFRHQGWSNATKMAPGKLCNQQHQKGYSHPPSTEGLQLGGPRLRCSRSEWFAGKPRNSGSIPWILCRSRHLKLNTFEEQKKVAAKCLLPTANNISSAISYTVSENVV